MPRPKNPHAGQQKGRTKRASAFLPGTINRTALQREQDRALIIELHNKQYTDQQIADALAATRPYKLSRRTIANERSVILDKLYDSQVDEARVKIDREIAKINKVEKQAWKDYLKTLEPQEVKDVRELSHDSDAEKESYVDTEIRTSTSNAKPGIGYLTIILRCIEQRSKLEGLYKIKLEIDKKEEITHHVKLYQEVSPSDWDVIEGELS